MKETRRVFISYARNDKELVGRVTEELDAIDVAFFLDEKHLDWGADVDATIESEIRDCSHLLVVISPASEKSLWVPYEVGIARAYGLSILPLLTHPDMRPLPFLQSRNYKSDISAIREYFSAPSSRRIRTNTSPKPYVVGDHQLDDLYLMMGNYTSPLPIRARYTHRPLEMPPEVVPELDEFRRLTAQRVRELGVQYFNGPNTRLVRFTEEGTRQLDDGSEQREITLELGPVSWEEYTLLNTFLDHPLNAGGTMRERFASRAQLFHNDRDMSWCRLSGILSLGIVPITADGFGLVQRRNPRGVSSEGGRYTSGVAENIHRYLDESPPGEMYRRLHDLELPFEVHSSGKVDVHYRPEGTPSPYLAAHRGLWEEVSESLADEISIADFEFLNIGFELSKFQPVLIGVVSLGLSRHEVERRIKTSPGRDHSEFLEILYFPLDHREPETARVMKDRSMWVPGGLGALISAIQFWRRQSR